MKTGDGFRLFRQTFTIPIPADAKRIERDVEQKGERRRKRFAQFKYDGRTITAPVTEKGKNIGQHVNVSAPKWYIAFRDALKIERKLPAFGDRKASEGLGRALAGLVADVQVNGRLTDPALVKAVAGWPDDIREKLVAWGLLEPERGGAAKTLTDHAVDYRQALRDKGNTGTHAELTHNRIKAIIDGLAARHVADLTGSKVLRCLAELRTPKPTSESAPERRGLSVASSNHYVRAIKGFAAWLQAERRTHDNPLSGLGTQNADTDVRHARRALTDQELGRLLATTEDGPPWRGISGPARSMLYRVAVETGLRANELRTLTVGAFTLGGDSPNVTVAAAYSKHRREDVQPIRLDVAAKLQAHFGAKLPGAAAFTMPEASDVVKMFRADLAAAGVAYRDDVGAVADFHALRHTFISNLARGGVHPKLAQTLARHSTITLTMDRYSHTLLGDLRDALDVLPDSEAIAAQQTPQRAVACGGGASCEATKPTPKPSGNPTAARITGGRDTSVCLSSCLAFSGGLRQTTLDSGGLSARDMTPNETQAGVDKTAVSGGKTQRFGLGTKSEPTDRKSVGLSYYAFALENTDARHAAPSADVTA